MSGRYDVVVVGGRVAGSVLAMRLARAGARVAMIDRDEFGSDTLSTHAIFPNTLATLERLGLLAPLLERHDVPMLRYRLRVLGHESAGTFTPVDGFDRCAAPRRVALDRVLAEAAQDAGVDARFGERVEELLGDGDRVSGVRLASGEVIAADWTVGADGRASTVAAKLGLRKTMPMAGDMAMLLAYWRGLPATDALSLDVAERSSLSRFPAEDGVELLVVGGGPELTRGGRTARERTYTDGLRGFPATLDPDALAGAERITEVRAAPETMLRGFFRPASGPGWVLVGDSGHFKHPATAQGIADAIDQAIHVADALGGGAATPNGYGAWRDRRAAGQYEFSYRFGTFPKPEISGPIFAGIAAEPASSQDLRDAMSRQVDPARVFSNENLARWFEVA